MNTFISKITEKIKSKQTPYCKFLFDSLFFDFKNNIKLCPFNDFGIIKTDFDGLWFDINQYLSVKQTCIENFKNQQIPEQCNYCCYLSKHAENEKNTELKELHLCNWKNCYINCSYCKFPKEEDLLKAGHYDIFPVLRQLIENKIISEKTKIVFECGDACIHPEFDKILFYFINFGMENVVINTPALRYCESVAEAVSKNIATVVVSIDSGCPYIYEQVKGINKYDITISNVKKYLKFQEPSQKRIVFKYTILNGVNDNQKEILDWFIFSKDLGIKKLAIDVEHSWYSQLQNNYPEYLKQLIKFAKDISIYNDIEIEFSQRANVIYKSITN